MPHLSVFVVLILPCCDLPTDTRSKQCVSDDWLIGWLDGRSFSLYNYIFPLVYGLAFTATTTTTTTVTITTSYMYISYEFPLPLANEVMSFLHSMAFLSLPFTLLYMSENFL